MYSESQTERKCGCCSSRFIKMTKPIILCLTILLLLRSRRLDRSIHYQVIRPVPGPLNYHLQQNCLPCLSIKDKSVTFQMFDHGHKQYTIENNIEAAFAPLVTHRQHHILLPKVWITGNKKIKKCSVFPENILLLEKLYSFRHIGITCQKKVSPKESKF